MPPQRTDLTRWRGSNIALPHVTHATLAMEPCGARWAVFTLTRPTLRLAHLTLTDLYETRRVCAALASSHQVDTLHTLVLRGPARPQDAPDDALLDLLIDSPLGARLQRLELYASRVTPARLRRLSRSGALPSLRTLHIHTPDPSAGLLRDRTHPNNPAQHELADAGDLNARIQARLNDVLDHARYTLNPAPLTPEGAHHDEVYATWRAQVGETVTTGQLICEMEGDKAAMELLSPGTGVLVHRSPDASGVLTPHNAQVTCTIAALLPNATIAPDAPHDNTPAPEADPATRSDALHAPAPVGAPVPLYARALRWDALRALAAKEPDRKRWDALIERLMLLARMDLLQTERFVADMLLDHIAHWPLRLRHDPDALVALRTARPNSPLLRLQHPVQRDDLHDVASFDALVPAGSTGLVLHGGALDLALLTTLLRDAPPRLRALELRGATDPEHANALCALVATARGCAHLEHLSVTGRYSTGVSEVGLEHIVTAPCAARLVYLEATVSTLDQGWLRGFTQRDGLPRLRALALSRRRSPAYLAQHPLQSAPEYPDTLDLEARIQRRLDEVASHRRARVDFSYEQIFGELTVESIACRLGQTIAEGTELLRFEDNILHDCVYSPLSGVVVAIHAREGETLKPDHPAPIVTLAALRPTVRLHQTPWMTNHDASYVCLDP